MVKDRVGGYLDYLALCDDARAYEDVLIFMAGEADAHRIMELQRKREGFGEQPMEPVATWTNEPAAVG